VRRIDALYRIEREIKDLSNEERTRIRREKALSLLESYRSARRRRPRSFSNGSLDLCAGASPSDPHGQLIEAPATPRASLAHSQNQNIGIGDALTRAPLPHHRTCGCASGSSAG
jgi:hypothetical protein